MVGGSLWVGRRGKTSFVGSLTDSFFWSHSGARRFLPFSEFLTFLIDDFGPFKRHRVCPYRIYYFKEFSPGQGRYFREHGEVPLTFLKHYTTLTK